VPRPHPIVTPDSAEFLTEPMISPGGFREYDARWLFPEQINLPGFEAVGLALGTQMFIHGLRPEIVVGHDFRSYSGAVKNALTLGLIRAGIHVHDIGLCLSPMAYFHQFHLDVPAVAMITASHNPNGWTGLKTGFCRPLTHGPDDMAELRDIVMNGDTQDRAGGGYSVVPDAARSYLDDLAGSYQIKRPLRIVCATGNGTASAFAPALLSRIGATVIPLHTELDFTFPHYNPNPEKSEMLLDMAAAVREHRADFAVGFDGDGDRCGVVDDTAREISSDKVGLLLARHYCGQHPGAQFVADVKSTSLFTSDPVLRASGAKTDYWKTGHSHMKRRVQELGALAGFERSGHYYLAPPIGRGYDCGPLVAVELCKYMDASPNCKLSELYGEIAQTHTTPTLAPACPDDQKYDVLARIIARLDRHRDDGGTLGGHAITDILKINGARVLLANGAWALVRASSNTPNLVVVCESAEDKDDLRRIFADLDRFVHSEPAVGDYDQHPFDENMIEPQHSHAPAAK